MRVDGLRGLLGSLASQGMAGIFLTRSALACIRDLVMPLDDRLGGPYEQGILPCLRVCQFAKVHQ